VVRGGDANFDGLVNFADFVILANNFGSTDALWSMGDFDGNRRVEFVDFVILSDHFDSLANVIDEKPASWQPSLLARASAEMCSRRSWRR
jgi:hypothetical protein